MFIVAMWHETSIFLPNHNHCQKTESDFHVVLTSVFLSSGFYFCFFVSRHMDWFLLFVIGWSDVKYIFEYHMLMSNVGPLNASLLRLYILIIDVISLMCVYGLTILYTDHV